MFDSVSKTRSGWTVGGGIAYAVTNNWSLGAEYRYSDFGSYNDFSAVALFPNSFVRHHITEHQVQARFSYKFDSLAPYSGRREILSRLAPTQAKPGREGRVLVAASVVCRLIRGIPATVTEITPHTRQ